MLTLHDIHVSYLPLAHMFERVVQVCCGLVYLQICRTMKSKNHEIIMESSQKTALSMYVSEVWEY